MDDPKKTATITIAVTPDLKDEIRAVAKSKRWSVSQTLGVLIEEYWDIWLKEMGEASSQSKKGEKESIS